MEAHASAILARDDAEAVVLDLVQPRVAGRRLRRFSRQAGGREHYLRGGFGAACGAVVVDFGLPLLTALDPSSSVPLSV